MRNAADLIDWAKAGGDAVSAWVPRNVEAANFRGLETEVELPDMLGVRLRARGAWTSLTASATPSYESKYALRPQVENVSLTADRQVLAHAQFALIGARERRLGESPYYKVDARGSIDLRGIRVWVDLRNALDEKYDDISYNPAAGRNAAVGLGWRSAP